MHRDNVQNWDVRVGIICEVSWLGIVCGNTDGKGDSVNEREKPRMCVEEVAGRLHLFHGADNNAAEQMVARTRKECGTCERECAEGRSVVAGLVDDRFEHLHREHGGWKRGVDKHEFRILEGKNFVWGPYSCTSDPKYSTLSTLHRLDKVSEFADADLLCIAFSKWSE